MMRLAIALMLIEREGPQAGPTLKQLGPRQRKSPEGKTGPRTNEVEVLVRGFWLKKLPMFQRILKGKGFRLRIFLPCFSKAQLVNLELFHLLSRGGLMLVLNFLDMNEALEKTIC